MGRYDDYAADREGAAWNSANEYYRLQYKFITEMTIGFAKKDFRHSYTFFKELFDYVFPYLPIKKRDRINDWIRRAQESIDALDLLGKTSQADMQRLRIQQQLFREMREHKLDLMVSMENAGLLNWSFKKDTRSIAEINNK